MKRVALYARVSTDRQEREETIASQLEQLRTLAADKGLAVLDRHVYIDDGYSGDELARPGMDRLRDDVRDGLVDVVMIHHPDRLARRYAYQVVIIEELEKHACEPYFVNRPIEDTPKTGCYWKCKASLRNTSGPRSWSGHEEDASSKRAWAC